MPTWPRYRSRVSEGAREVVSGSGGLTLRATAVLDPAVADVIVVPGCWRTSRRHPGMDLLDATGAVAVAARVVDDGDLVTAAGVTSGLDLGLHLLDRLLGPRIAHAVEQLFGYERRGVVWGATGPEPVAL